MSSGRFQSWHGDKQGHKTKKIMNVKTALRRQGKHRRSAPPQAENPAWQDFVYYLITV